MHRQLRLFGIICILFCTSFSNSISAAAHTTRHPFYISVTEITHNAKEKTLEISCKMFADDFEQVLEKNYHLQLDIGAEKDKPSFNRVIPDYMNRHFFIAADGRTVKLEYVGFEKEKESVFCYFQVSGLAALKTMNISNSILHDFNTSQINIIHAIVGGKRQSTKLDYPQKEASFNF